MAAANKEAIAFILDTGPEASRVSDGKTSFLQKALQCITLVLQRKVFSESKDEVALVLFGTDDTDNQLAADDEEYRNIVVKWPLAVVNWEFMQMVQEDIRPGSTSGDFLDAVIVAMDHLQNEMGGRKFAGQQIYLLSCFEGETSAKGLEEIINGMKNSDIQLNVIGPDLESREARAKPKSIKQKHSEAVIRRILKSLGSESITFEEAVPLLSFFKSRGIRSAPWKANLDLGGTFQIPVCAYIKIRKFVPKTFKKSYGMDPGAKLQTERSYHKKDVAQTECEKEETVSGYKYGKTLVPFTEEDKANMAYESLGNSEKCFSILAFSKQDCIKRHHYLGEGVSFVVADTTVPEASTALSAFIHALYETSMVAIVRQIYRNKCSPKIGFLAPRIKTDHECLIFVHLPYMEDLRRYTFAPLNSNPKNIPSDEQLSAIDELITTMTMEGSGNEKKPFKPSQLCNPYIQRLYQCMLHRGLHPDKALPSTDEAIMKHLEPDNEILDACQSVGNKLKDLFPLKVLATKQEKRTGKDTFQDGLAEPASKVPKLSEEDAFLDNDMTSFSRGKVTEVGTTNPTKDFLSIIKNESKDLQNAGSQLQKVIIKLVMDSFGKLACQENYSKALECLKVLRLEFTKDLSNEFNDFLENFKKDLLSKQKLDFWEKLKYEKIGLISKTESSSSNVTDNQAEMFFTTVIEKQHSPPSSLHGDDVDDLLDEL